MFNQIHSYLSGILKTINIHKSKLILLILVAAFSIPLTAEAQINLSISKTNNAPNPIPSGQPFTYTITYSWSGGAPGTLYIVDNIPASLDVISALPSSPVSTISGNNVVFTLTGLSLPSGSGTVQINARFKPGITCGGVRACNQAGISTQKEGEYIFSEPSCVTSADPVNRWSIEKEWIAGCAVDDDIIYRIKITAPAGNDIGGVNLTNINLQDLVPTNAIITNVTGSWYGFSGSNPYTLSGPSTLYVNSYPVWYTAYVTVKYPSPYFNSGDVVLNTATVSFTTPCDSTPVIWTDTATTTLCSGVSQGNIYKWLSLNLYFPNNPSYYPVWTPGCCGTYTLYYNNTGTLSQPGFVMEDDLPGQVDLNAIKTYVPPGNSVTVDVYCWSGSACSTTPCTTAVYTTNGYHTTTSLPANVCKVKWTYSNPISVNQTLYNYLDVCVRATDFMTGATVIPGQNITNTMTASASNLSAISTTHTKPVDTTQPKIVATKLFIGGCNPPCTVAPNGPFQPGDTVRFRMAVANIGSQNATNCTITDNLPSYLSYVGNETYFYGGFNYMVNQYNPPCCSTSTTVPSNIGGTIVTPTPGSTSLTWTFPVLPSRCDGTVEYLIIDFDVVISAMPPAPPGQYQNTFTINATNHGNVNSNIAFLTVNQTAQVQAMKEVRKVAPGTPGPWNMSATIPIGGSGEYKITVKNTGNTQLSNLCLLDIMPWVGDIKVLPPYNPRNSMFNLPYNPTAGSINISPAGFGATYNTIGLIPSQNPTRSTECGGFCGVADPSGATTGTFVSSAAQTYSFKISASSGTNLMPGNSLTAIIPFDMPAQIKPQENACNSFGVQAVPLGIPNVCLSAESNNACIVAAEPEPCMRLGDNRINCISTDANGNSIYQVSLNITNLGSTTAQLFINPSISSISSFAPNTLPPGVPTSVQMIFISPDSINSVCFTISLIYTNDPDQKMCDTTICFDYKPCPSPCPCPFDIRIDKPQASQASGNQAFFNNLISISTPVLQMRASVVSATVTQYCWWGGSSSYSTSATFASSTVNPIYIQGLGTSELTYTNYQCPQINNHLFGFYLNIPNAPHFGCYQNVKVCIRYTITDCKCSTCDTLICYEFRRKWMPISEKHDSAKNVIGNIKITNKDNTDMPQIAAKPFLEMEMKNETEGMFTVNNPAEDEYTAGITIHKVSLKAAAGIKVKSMTPDRKTWNSGVPTDNGLTCTGILNPGGSIVFTVEFDNTANFKQWLNDVTIAYTIEGVPDTLNGSLKIKSRTPGVSGGDLLLQDFDNTGTATRARTFAFSFDAYNLSADSIAKVVLRVKDGSIIAVGPPMSGDSTHLESYFTTGGQWKLLSPKPDENIAVMSPVPQGTTIQPVFITAVYNSEEPLTINYETFNSDNDLITKGSLTVETQTTGINGDIIEAAISLSEAIPNPAQNKTLIKFNLSKDELAVSLIVTDVRGAVVKRLLTNESYQSGQHELLFDTSKLTDGVYYYTLTTSSASQTRRLVILK